jgi:two-component system sensor histidine kinase TctE
VRVTPERVVEVSDDGPSIPEAERERVFERFHRLLGSSHDGSGLGLAIAQEVARIHGAAITLRDDADGVGNTFAVAFPPP